MDLHSLTRKELQSLCKQHRIPANMTNVAMADALQALLDVGEMEGSVQDTLQNQTPKKSLASAAAPIRSSRRTSSRRPAEVVAPASVEPKDHPASPLPRARRVVARASEIRRLVSEDDVEEEKKEVLVENTPMTTTVKRGRRTSKKGNDDIKKEGAVETTPMTRNGRRMTARGGAETKAVEQDETDYTVLSSRTTTRRTRQSSKAIVVDVATTATRSTRARTRASVIETGTLAPEAEQVEKEIEVKICAERDGDSSFPSGEKTMDWKTGDIDSKEGNLVVVEDGTGEPEAEEYADMKELEGLIQEKEYELSKGDTDDKYEECHLAEVDTDIYQHQLTTEAEVEMAAPEADAVVVLEGLTQEKEELVEDESDELAQDEVASPKGDIVNLELENAAQEEEDEVISPLAEGILALELENEAREKELEEKGSLDKDDQCIGSLLPYTEKTLDLASMDADVLCEQECNLVVNDNTSPQQQLPLQIEEYGIATKEAEEFAEVELEIVAQKEGGDEETERGSEIKCSLKRGDDVDDEVSHSAEVDISNICSMDLKDIVEGCTEGDEDEIVNRKDCEQDSNAVVTNLPDHELIVNAKEDGMTRDAPVITERGSEIKCSLKRGDDVDDEVSYSAEVDISNICSMDLKDIVEGCTEGDEDEIVNRKDCEQDSNAVVTNLPDHELIVNAKEDGMTRDAPVITEEQEPNKADDEFPGLKGSPVLGLVSSLEKLTILGDAGDEQNKEVEEMRLALLPEDEISTETDISITLNQVSIDAGNEKPDEVIGSVLNSEIAGSNNVDLPAGIVGKVGEFQEHPDVIFEVGKGEEKSQYFEPNNENDIEVAVEIGAEKKSQCCEANKENIGEVALENGADLPVDLNEMSLIKLKRLYKEKINNINNNKVAGRRLALTEINDNIAS